MTTWDERISLLEKQVDGWNAELDVLKEIYDSADERSKAKHQIDLISLELKLEESIMLLGALYSEEEYAWRKELKEKYNEGVSIMKKRVDEAKEKFEEFDETTDEVWKDLMAGIEKSTKSLSEAVEKAKARFKD